MTFKSLLPPNAHVIEKALEQALDRREAITKASIVGTDFFKLRDPKSYLMGSDGRFSEIADLLPYYAWSKNIPIWVDEWSVEQKINLILAWETVLSKAGTKWALQTAYEAIGVDAVIDDNLPEPFCFEVKIRQALTDKEKENVRKLTDILKRHVTKYDLRLIFAQSLRVGASLVFRMKKITKFRTSD